MYLFAGHSNPVLFGFSYPSAGNIYEMLSKIYSAKGDSYGYEA